MNRILRISISVCFSLAILIPLSAEAVSPNPTPDCSAGATCSVNFQYSGDYYAWTVPSTGNYTIEAWGAQGGGTGTNYWGTGGKGGYAKGVAALTSGQVIYIYVGQQGYLSDTSTAFNGGGWGTRTNGYISYTGGGATHVATTGGLLSTLSGNISSIFLVAGGGGGAAGSANSSWSAYAANGGAGGGLNGDAGVNSNGETPYRQAGGGGTQSAGGASSTYSGQVAAAVATFGKGANGTAAQADGISGGGGGGGYYGGGSGADAGGGGGGGSGYLGSLTSTQLVAGSSSMVDPNGGTMTGRSGNGLVRITYANSPVVVTISTSGNVRQVSKGESLTLIAGSDAPGKVTFYSDGKKIAGCIALPISIGNRSCVWKGTVQKTVKVKAFVAPAGGGISAYSPEISIFVTRRTGLRS